MIKYRYQFSCLAALASISFIIIWGCVHYQGEGAVGTIIATSEAFKSFDGEYENSLYFKDHKPESIAVLPFSSLDEKIFAVEDGIDRPEEIVRKGLYNHISSLPFMDLEMFDTDKRLFNAGVKNNEAINGLIADNPKKLKSILGADAVVTGAVTHFDRIFVGVYSQVAVGCEVKMWDLESGNLLWRAKHVSRAHAGGISLNPIGLLLSAAASAWNLRDEELLSQTDELFREIVSTIEVPSAKTLTRKSKAVIDLFAVMNATQPFTAGREISFRLIGDPGCRAYVDLGNYRSAIDLSPADSYEKEAMKSDLLSLIQTRFRETGENLSAEMKTQLEKGFDSREIYNGSYTVSPGEERYGLTAKAYLVNPFGDQTFKLDVLRRIDIDANPPGPAADLSTESLDRKVRIYWQPNPEADLAAYEIWTSQTPLSGFSLAKTSQTHDVYLDSQTNFNRFYIKVRAMDLAGNRGPFGTVAEAVALPQQGLYDLPQPGPVLEGSIHGSILLIRAKSPYRVLSDMKIDAGAALYIEPGVVILFSPKAALVADGGSLCAYGRKDLPVQLAPAAAETEKGSWRGLILKRSSHTLLNHVDIQSAEIGITVMNSSPEIYGAVVRDCTQAGLYLKENAAPTIACSLFLSNGGQGAMVIEGAGITPTVQNNTFIANKPFQIQSYTPLEVDMTGNYWGQSVPNESMFLGNIVWQPFLSAPSESCDRGVGFKRRLP